MREGEREGKSKAGKGGRKKERRKEGKKKGKKNREREFRPCFLLNLKKKKKKQCSRNGLNTLKTFFRNHTAHEPLVLFVALDQIHSKK